MDFCFDTRVISETALQLFPRHPNLLPAFDLCNEMPTGAVFPTMCQYLWDSYHTTPRLPRGGLLESPV